MSFNNQFRCRIQSITIENIKNVSKGVVRMKCNMGDDIFADKSDILGIYGQNGSGKTAAIVALCLLKHLVNGKQIWADMDELVKVGEDHCRIKFVFSLEMENGKRYLVTYDVTIKVKEGQRSSSLVDDAERVETYVAKEALKYKIVDDSSVNRNNYIFNYQYENGDSAVFGPNVRYKQFISKDKNLIDDLKYHKTDSYQSRLSFIFTLYKIENIQTRMGYDKELLMIINAIQCFCIESLFVITNSQNGAISANITIPMNLCKYDGDMKRYHLSYIDLSLVGETNIPLSLYEDVTKRFDIINSVINKVIPDLNIYVVKRGNRIAKDGTELVIAELMSKRGEDEIPLCSESDGIKKLIYCMYGLIQMFNNPSATTVIDELDSGVFEYLLGEILKVLEESGKGQLIFTSHNLRPLEVLDKKSILFSTTNENNRYIRFKNVKSTNNLRDFYYQSILLGGQDECVYNPTRSSAIRRAFKSVKEDLNG